MPDARRATVVTLLLLVALTVGLALAPRDVASIRVGGVSVLWWYGGVLAPALSATAAAAAMLGTRRTERRRAAHAAGRNDRSDPGEHDGS